MATEAMENRMLDRLLTVAQTINGGPTFNTNPAIKQVDLPKDALAQGGGEAIFLLWFATEQLPSLAGRVHQYSAEFQAWCVGDTNREALNVADDFRIAIESDEQLDGLAKEGVWLGMAIPDPEQARRIGKPLVIRTVRATYETTH